MKKGKILLADNRIAFLRTRKFELEEAGYEVITALNPAEARAVLEHGWVHLAIIDLRLTDDSPGDISGLLLVKETDPAVPKIILTAHPNFEAAREMLQPDANGVVPAVRFVTKQEGVPAMLEAVEHCFKQNVRINLGLDIDWGLVDPYALAHYLAPGHHNERLVCRAEEIEDLLRRLFLENRHVLIKRILWQRKGRAALAVFVSTESGTPEWFVVTCSRKKRGGDEVHRYKDFAPSAPGHNSTVLTKSEVATHFAANAFALASTDLESVKSLSDLYQSEPDRLFSAAVNNLFRVTLDEWHQRKRMAEGDVAPGVLYRNLLGLGGDEGALAAAAFEERVALVIHDLPMHGSKIERADGKLTLRFEGQSFTYDDPAPALSKIFASRSLTPLTGTPGVLTGDNVLVDAEGRAWLTDFADAGLAPQAWDYVMLEAAIRFDWLPAAKLKLIHAMELRLVGDEFAKLSADDIEPKLRKPLKAIRAIRQLATRTVGKDALPYHLGILFQALSRLADPKSVVPFTPNELIVSAHALISAAMVYDHVLRKETREAAQAKEARSGFRIDKDNRRVWVEGQLLPLPKQLYELFAHLHEHVNQLCTDQELIEILLREVYVEDNEHQKNCLSAAIYRLRDKLQTVTDNPRQLIVRQSNGYRLVIPPDVALPRNSNEPTIF